MLAYNKLGITFDKLKANNKIPQFYLLINIIHMSNGSSRNSKSIWGSEAQRLEKT